MASAYLRKAHEGAGNRKTFTISAWVKRAVIGGDHTIFSQGIPGGGYYSKLRIRTDDVLQYEDIPNTGNVNLKTNKLFRDINAWYHIVVRVDTTQSTAADRVRIYVNGTQETSFSTANYPSQNNDQQANENSSMSVTVGGRTAVNGAYWDGQMAHVHYSDGQSYAPTTFGETDSNGVWIPKTSPTVSYGVNGFFLKFDNDSNMGLDSSGQSHNLTTTGTIIQNKDTPSNVHCVLNDIDKRFDDTTLTNVGLTVSGGRISTGFDMIRGTLGADSGKWYFEMKAADNAEIDQVGIGILNNISMQNEGANGFNGNTQDYGVQMSNGYKVGVGQSGAAYMGGFTTNDICMIAVDLENDKITFGRNGQWANGSGGADQTYANSTAAFTGLNDTRGYIPMFANRNSGNNNTGIMHFNFGNGYFGTTKITSAGSKGNGSLFEYDVPTGFYAWNTKNLKDQS